MSQERQKILYIITKSNWGGAQRYVYDLATVLPRDTHDAVVALGGSGVLKQKLEEKNIRVISIPFMNRDIRVVDDMRAFFFILNFIFGEKPSVIHLNSPKAGGLGVLAARMYNGAQKVKKLLTTDYRLPTRIIFTAHGWEFNAPHRGVIVRIFFKIFSWFIIMLTHKTIAVSEAVRRDIILFPFISKKVVVIRNGVVAVPTLSRAIARAQLRARNSLFESACEEMKTDPFIVGIIAELHPTKGLSYAVEAAAIMKEKNPDMLWVVCGEGEERQSLESLVKKYSLENVFFLLGNVADAKLFMSSFDIFLLPSISEGLAYVLLEAGIAGLPAVATNVGGIPEIVRNGETGILVPPKNPRAIADALSILMQDKKKAVEYGALFSADVKKRFSIEQMIKSTEQLYKSDGLSIAKIKPL